MKIILLPSWNTSCQVYFALDAASSDAANSNWAFTWWWSLCRGLHSHRWWWTIRFSSPPLQPQDGLAQQTLEGKGRSGGNQSRQHTIQPCHGNDDQTQERNIWEETKLVSILKKTRPWNMKTVHLPLIAIEPDVRVFTLHHHHLRLPHPSQAALCLLLQIILSLESIPEIRFIYYNRFGSASQSTWKPRLPQVRSFGCEWQLAQVRTQLLPRQTRWARPGRCQGSPPPGWGQGSWSCPGELLEACQEGRRLCQGGSKPTPVLSAHSARLIPKLFSRNWRFFTVFMSKGWLEVRFPGQWWLLYVAADRPNAWVQTRSIVFKKVQALVGGGPSQWVRPCRRQIQLLTGALPCFAQMPPSLLLLCRHVPWTTNIFAKLR